MPFIVAETRQGTGPLYTLSDGDTFILPMGASLIETGYQAAVQMSGSVQLKLYGTVSGSGVAIRMPAQMTSGASVAIEVGPSAMVSGTEGVILQGTGRNSIVNAGTIYSTSTNLGVNTIVMNGQGTLLNTGNILNLGYGVAVYFVGSYGSVINSGSISTGDGPAVSGVSYLINDGSITSPRQGSAVSGASGGLTLTNNGVISGADALSGAISAGSGPTYVTNNGSISGGILLRDGLSMIRNAGEITGAIATFGVGTVDLTNTGTMTGAVALGFGPNVVCNSGLISGAISAFASADTVRNSGVIDGSVALAGGNDLVDNTYGVITGNIVGGLGDDTIIGGAQRDVIYGDNISGDTTGGNDLLSGGYGDDLIFGGYGNDQLYGNQGDDVLYGNQGDDWMHGGQGADMLYGGQGNDTINGGVGDDVLYGNLGDDLFVFSGPGFGHDVIADSGAGADRIQFAAGVFADFADLQAHTRDLNGGVLITDAVGDTVFLAGVTASSLTAAQFVFG